MTGHTLPTIRRWPAILSLLVVLTSLAAAAIFICWYTSGTAGSPIVLPATSKTVPLLPTQDPITPTDPLNQALQAPANWTTLKGAWTITPNSIRGAGDSSLLFRKDLPPDIRLSFIMTVISGMRPRVYFDGPQIYFGNEGYKKRIFVYGYSQTTVTGPHVPYINGQPLRIVMTLHSGTFRLEVNDQVLTGPCTPCDHIRLRLRGGDGWSRGTTLITALKVEALNHG